MKAPWAAILLGLLTTVSAEARGQSRTVYVPVFDVIAEFVPYPDLPYPQEGSRWWTSHLSAFNAGKETVSVTTATLFGPDGEYTLQRLWQTVLLPGTGREVDIPTQISEWERPVLFAVVSVPPETLVTADVERRLQLVRACGSEVGFGNDTGRTELGDGRAPLPAFEALFPAGARVVAGPVDLGNPHAHMSCTSAPIYYGRRRVNVTLFNAGDADTVFVIKAFRMGTLPGDAGPVLVQSVPLGAKRVYQANDVPILDAFAAAQPASHAPGPVWVSVEATQPFLAYVSSVFIDPEPATLPFQVFAPRLMP